MRDCSGHWRGGTKGNAMTGERFIITLEAVPRDSRPAALRLRGALKTLLRGFGLRCVTMSRVVELKLDDTIKELAP